MEIRLVENNQLLYLKGKKEAVLFDPDEGVLKKAKYPARIVAYSRGGEKHWNSAGEDRVVLTGPGEYEVGGVELNGYSTSEGATIYIVTIDKVVVGVVSGLKEMLSDKKIEKIAGVDVLVFSIEKNNVLVAKDIVSLAKKWGANYLVPMGFDLESERFKKFLDETDSESAERLEALKVDKDSLPDGLETVVVWTK